MPPGFPGVSFVFKESKKRPDFDEENGIFRKIAPFLNDGKSGAPSKVCPSFLEREGITDSPIEFPNEAEVPRLY